eukprot:g888.t1
MVCRLLDRMCKLDSQIGVIIPSERWGGFSFFLDQVHSGIQDAVAELKKQGEGDDTSEDQMQELYASSLYAWFLLIEEIFTATFTTGNEVQNKSQLSATSLTQATFFDPIFSAMEICTESTFISACKACLAINYHYASRSENKFIVALLERDKNRRFGEALIFLLNEQSAPCNNSLLPKQILRCIIDLMSDASSSSYFYTNDLNVVIDVCLREIRNLDSVDSLRVDYLMALSLILRNSSWAMNGAYRRQEIITVVSDVGKGGDYDTKAVEAAKSMLSECRSVLVAAHLEATETLLV